MKKLKLTIEIECGSDFQHRLISDTFNAYANSMDFYKNTHKKNKITTNIEES